MVSSFNHCALDWSLPIMAIITCKNFVQQTYYIFDWLISVLYGHTVNKYIDVILHWKDVDVWCFVRQNVGNVKSNKLEKLFSLPLPLTFSTRRPPQSYFRGNSSSALSACFCKKFSHIFIQDDPWDPLLDMELHHHIVQTEYCNFSVYVQASRENAALDLSCLLHWWEWTFYRLVFFQFHYQITSEKYDLLPTFSILKQVSYFVVKNIIFCGNLYNFCCLFFEKSSTQFFLHCYH